MAENGVSSLPSRFLWDKKMKYYPKNVVVQFPIVSTNPDLSKLSKNKTK
jgi:hypothetical protein